MQIRWFLCDGLDRAVRLDEPFDISLAHLPPAQYLSKALQLLCVRCPVAANCGAKTFILAGLEFGLAADSLANLLWCRGVSL